MVDKVKQGKKNRASGASFELRVRKDLESKGWIVDKWSNNVEFNACDLSKPFRKQNLGKLIPAKRKYLGPGRPIVIGTGFPDFICLRYVDKISGEIFRKIVINEYKNKDIKLYEVIGVEAKSNGYLDKEEKEKCKWLLDNNVFSKILIAEKTKVKNKIVIVYHDFEDKYGKSY